MGANPHANGGLLLKELVMPDFRAYGVTVKKPGAETAESTRILGGFLRDVMKLNEQAANFRVFGPDETASNRLDAFTRQHPKNGWNRSYRPMSTCPRTAASLKC